MANSGQSSKNVQGVSSGFNPGIHRVVGKTWMGKEQVQRGSEPQLQLLAEAQVVNKTVM